MALYLPTKVAESQSLQDFYNVQWQGNWSIVIKGSLNLIFFLGTRTRQDVFPSTGNFSWLNVKRLNNFRLKRCCRISCSYYLFVSLQLPICMIAEDRWEKRAKVFSDFGRDDDMGI